jgi:hypothetical protein
MNNKLKPVCFFVGLALCFSIACEKYEEGGNTARAWHKVLGDKKLVSYTINGTDAMEYLKDSAYLATGDIFFSFYNEGYSKYFSSYSDKISLGGEWSISVDKKTLSLYIYDNSIEKINSGGKIDSITEININNTFEGDWNICRLKRSGDLWLKRSNSGYQYELKFEKKTSNL